MKKESSQSERTLLTVLAHPDDETFGMGGTLAYYAQQGVDVHLICATRGEVGEIDPEFTEAIKSPACLRTQELRCAAQILGIREVHFLNYRDSGMPGAEANHHPKALAAQPIDEVAMKISHTIRQIRPDIVLTFDPIGGYRHPDHIAVHLATVRAFDLASDEKHPDPDGLPPFQPRKLYFHVMNRAYLRVMVWLMRLIGKNPRKYGQNEDIDLVSISEVRFPTHARVNYRPVRKLRDKAAACHASQGGEKMNKGFRGFVVKLFSDPSDTYMQAYPEPQMGARISRDLFG
ncbi:MAG: PIG-L deacetylase family protein [Brevefilum sp.]